MATAPIELCVECTQCQFMVQIPPDVVEKLKLKSNLRSGPIPQSGFGDPFVSAPASNNMWIASQPHIVGQPGVPPTITPSTGLPQPALSEYESSWRNKFLGTPVLILGNVQGIFTVLIIILEIASLALSTYKATGAGFWCSIVFVPVSILTVLLVTRNQRARYWATRVLIGQIVLLIFSFILIGIVGSYVSSGLYYAGASDFTRKFQVMQAQLAFAVLLMFSGWVYVIFYMVVTYLALWKPFGTLDTPHLFRA